MAEQAQRSSSTHLREMQSEKTDFKRGISLFGGINILAGIMIGSGIFYLGSYVLMYSGMSQKLSLIVWVIGGLVTLFCGLCYAELGAMLPKAGGGYVYLREAYGSRVAFMSGFSGFLIGNSGSNAALAAAFASVLGTFVPMDKWTTRLVAISAIVLLTAINYVGVKSGSLVQNIFNITKLLPIGLIMIGGFVKGKQPLNPEIVPVGTSPVKVISMIALGVVATLWAYEGWTNLNVVSEEIENPKRNLPLAIIISIAAVTVIYVLFNYSIYRVVPFATIQQMLGEGNFYLGTESARLLFGNAGSYIVGAAMLIAIFGSLNGCVMVFPRYYYSMAQDGMMFKSFGKLHPKYKTPGNAIIASMIFSCILVLLLELGDLTQLVVFSGMLFNALILFSVIIFRKKHPDLERPYKVWFYPVSVIFTVAVMIGLMVNSFIDNPVLPLLNLIVPIIGLFIHMGIEKRNANAAVVSDEQGEE